jgi:hypothetical protein
MSLSAFVRQSLTIGTIVAALNAIVLFLGSRWIEGKINSQFERSLEDYRFELKTREQAAKIAEYAALASTLKDTDDPETYRRANQLAWELFLWLPADVYRKLGRGLAGNTVELSEALVDVRKVLLGEQAGNLNENDLIVHAPDIGKKR